MYKVLIVDDEPFILDGLKHVINWEEHGLEIIASAKNGIEALEIMEKSKVDILITDIKMPKMDGLELMRNIKQKNLNMKTIILSGYSEFDYAREAARLGIENYLLKPIEEEELSATLLTTVEKLEVELKNKLEQISGLEIIKRNILYRWVTGSIADSELKQRSDMVGIDLCSNFYLAGLIKISANHANQPVCGNDPDIQQGEYSDIGLLQLTICSMCKDIIKAYGNNKVFNSLNGEPVIIFSWNEQDYNYQEVMELLSHCVESIKEKLRLDIKAFIGSIEQDYMSISKSYNNAVTLAEQYSLNPHDSIIDWSSSSNFIQANQELNIKAHNFSPLIKKVLNYIDTFYHDEISLKTLSVVFDVNPAYLGQLFKKETGDMFTNYLNGIRIEKAKEMLVNTDFKASEIGLKTGYTNPNYFYNIFYKHNGMYPTEYRKKFYSL